MSFLTDQNLTFHRFSDGTMSYEGGPKSRKISHDPTDESGIKRKFSNLTDYQPPAEMHSTVWTTKSKYNNYSTNNPDLVMSESTTSSARIIPDGNTTTPSTINDFNFLSSTPYNTTASSGAHPHHNGSTMKLITVAKEDTTDQSKNQQVGPFTILCYNLLKFGKFFKINVSTTFYVSIPY